MFQIKNLLDTLILSVTSASTKQKSISNVKAKTRVYLVLETENANYLCWRFKNRSNFTKWNGIIDVFCNLVLEKRRRHKIW